MKQHLLYLLISIVIITLFYFLGPSILLCEGADGLPSIMRFGDLHLTDSIKEAKETLKGQSGIYCMFCQETGSMYIGSACDMGGRLMDHVFNYSSNIHLQRAIALYGLPAFLFLVVEFCSPDMLISREQLWLNWLFSLPAKSRFNFNPTAGSSLGYRHTEEAKAKISAAMTGRVCCPGNQHASKTVSVWDLNGNRVAVFHSVSATAKWLQVSQPVVSKALKRGYVVKGTYRVKLS